MKNHVVRYVTGERIRQGLNRAELARLMGYSNVTRGMNRILDFEREGSVHPDILRKMADALKLDIDRVKELLEKDREEYERAFEEWADVPIRMYLVIRYMAAVYGRHPLPEDVVTTERAEEYACSYARDKGFMVCLVLSRRQSVWINREGEVYHRSEATPYESNVPYMKLKNSDKKFLFKISD